MALADVSTCFWSIVSRGPGGPGRAWRSRAVALALVIATASGARAAWPEPARGERAMVVTAHPLATAAGIQILHAGGNAVDAAVAVSLALSVVEPWSSGLGGGGFAVVHRGDVTTTWDMREAAPAAATANMFLVDGKVVAGESTSGPRAAGIPGLVRGLAVLHARYGKLRWAQVVQPALTLAREGFPASARLAQASAEGFGRMNAAAQRVFGIGRGRAVTAGERIVQADLAGTLERIAATQGEDFYTGVTAAELVRAVRAEGGIWTAEDLAAYAPKERPPVFGRYRGHALVSMGPPSSGGLLVVEMLAVLERFPPAPWNGVTMLHRLAEVMKRAFALRATGLADPDFATVDRERFIGTPAIDRLAREVTTATRATPAKKIGLVKVKAPDRPNTTHFAIVTAEGDGVAMTQTINLRFGNGRIAGSTGVVLNDEMDDFAAAPGVPNAFGLIGDAANAVAAGKRPLSSMTPTLMLEGGRVVGAFGSPGGSRIISTTLQCILRVVDDGMDASQAVSAPRVHHQWYPDQLEAEPFAFAPETRAGLAKLGHAIKDVGGMGNAMVIVRRADGVLEGAADPRGEGSAVGL